MLTKRPSDVFGIIAEFDTPEELMAAARQVRDAGYKKVDAFAPFPVEGLSQAIGFKDKLIPTTMLIAGIVGIIWGLGVQFFGLGLSYPLNIGGRPLWSWPNFIPITFEATVLTAAWTGGIAMFAFNGLPQLYHPVFDAPNFDRASTDAFFLLIEAKDPKFERVETMKFLQGLGTERVNEVEVRH
jgi:hypothetical protein